MVEGVENEIKHLLETYHSSNLGYKGSDEMIKRLLADFTQNFIQEKCRLAGKTLQATLDQMVNVAVGKLSKQIDTISGDPVSLDAILSKTVLRKLLA